MSGRRSSRRFPASTSWHRERSSRASDAQYEPLFVGETADLSAALKSHPRDECFQMYYGNVVGVLKESDDARRTSILADLLDGLAPPCNAPDAT